MTRPAPLPMTPTSPSQLDVVEVLLLGPLLQRVHRRPVHQRLVLRVAEARRCRRGSPSRPGTAPARRGPGQRVDLDQRGVLGDERLPQLDRDLERPGRPPRPGTAPRRRSRAPWPRPRPRSASIGDLGDPLRGLLRDLLDVHAAGDAGDAQEACARRGPAGRRGSTPRRCRRSWSTITLPTVWPLMSMPEDVGGAGCASSGVVGQLHATGLAAPPDLHLGLDHHLAAQPLGDVARLLRGGGDATAQHRQPVLFEQRRVPGTRTGPRPRLPSRHMRSD